MWLDGPKIAFQQGILPSDPTGSVLVECELGSESPPNCELRLPTRRADQKQVGALLMQLPVPESVLRKSSSGHILRSNGPFRTESLPYPRYERPGVVSRWQPARHGVNSMYILDIADDLRSSEGDWTEGV